MDFIPFLWATAFAIATCAAGGTYGVLGMTPPRYNYAKILFLISGASCFGIAMLFGLTVPVLPIWRIIGTGLIGALAAIGTVEALLWIKAIEPPPLVVADNEKLKGAFAYALKISIGFKMSPDENNNMPTRRIQMLITQTNSIERPIKAIITHLDLEEQTLAPNHQTIIRARDSSTYQSDVLHISTRPRSGTFKTQIEYGPVDGKSIRRLTRRDRFQWPLQPGAQEVVTEVDEETPINE